MEKDERKNLLDILKINPNDMDVRIALLDCDLKLCRQQQPDENEALAMDVLAYAPLVLEIGMRGCDIVYRASSRLADAVSSPKLRYDLLGIAIEALFRIEAETGHELGITEDLVRERGKLKW